MPVFMPWPPAGGVDVRGVTGEEDAADPVAVGHPHVDPVQRLPARTVQPDARYAGALGEDPPEQLQRWLLWLLDRFVDGGLELPEIGAGQGKQRQDAVLG